MAVMSCRSGLELLGDVAARNALEGLDDDHAAAAAGTGMRQCLGLAVPKRNSKRFQNIDAA
jgi:hypothetical protein